METDSDWARLDKWRAADDPREVLIGQALGEAITHGCLQPTTLGRLERAGVARADLAEALRGLLKQAPAPGDRLLRVRIKALQYLVSRLSQLDGLAPGPTIDEAWDLAVVRALVQSWLPPAKGAEPHAARRRALGELLAWGTLAAETQATLKPADREAIRQALMLRPQGLDAALGSRAKARFDRVAPVVAEAWQGATPWPHERLAAALRALD